MSESAKSRNDVPLETSIPAGGASLESILCTEELHDRPWRPREHEMENRALVALANAFAAESRDTILQTLAETILQITKSDSSGVSLLTTDDGGKRFYWPAVAGMWKPHAGGGTPRNFGPCGDVLDHNRALLFRHFERRYPYLPVEPPATECLLVPFYIGDKAVGTIWAIMHSDRHKFDAEDERLMNVLGQFASLAYQTLATIDDLKLQMAAREKAETAMRELANGLEAKVRRLVDANIMGIFIWNLEGKIVEANDAFLHIVEYNREDLVSGCMRWTELTPPGWRDRDERALADLEALGSIQPYKKEFLQKGGSPVPVLVGAASFEGGEGHLGVAFVLDLREQKRAEGALRQLSGRLLHLQDEERRRIARHLHETVAQSLAAAMMNLAIVEESKEALDKRTCRSVEEIRSLLQDSIRKTRTLSYLLHPPLLDESGLPSALRWYTKGFEQRSGVRVDLQIPANLGRLSQETETTLFRIVQECLTNIHRHSGSSTATITVRQNAGELILEVKDEGHGMPPRILDSVIEPGAVVGVGIAGMHERVMQLGGRMDIQSGSQGTTVKAVLRFIGARVCQESGS